MSNDEQMLQTYRHDAHKVRGRSHSAGSRKLAGVRVNLDVPYGADADAAALSRPSGKPEQTVENHDTHYRLSLLSGDTQYDPDEFALHHYEDELHRLLAVSDPVAMHRRWLESPLMAAFNESTYQPYTSLKYHTLIAASLVANYREGYEFDDLQLVVDHPDSRHAHRTIYRGEQFALYLTGEETTKARASLGSRPWRSFASTWSRLSGQPPLDTENDRFDMYLDANLRRIQSWSTALQYIEDFERYRRERQ